MKHQSSLPTGSVVSTSNELRDSDVLPFDGDHDHLSQQKFDHLTLEKWCRPSMEVKTLDSKQDSIACFQIDVEHQLTNLSHFAHSLYRNRQQQWKDWNTTVPIIQIFGITALGTSILVNVHGFFPYLYFECPISLQPHTDIIQKRLDDELKFSAGAKNLSRRVLRVDLVKRRSLMYYNGEEKKMFCSVTLASPKLVSSLRGIIERQITIEDPQTRTPVPIPSEVFEANIPFELRYMIDTSMVGCSWIEIPAERYYLRTPNEKQSHCQIELDLFVDDLIVHPPSGGWLSLAPLRILSFDIECVTASGRGFPAPETDKVIQIASVLTAQGCSDPIFKVVFTLNSCSGIPGATVVWFEREEDMLMKWKDLIIRCDPDIITGYNCINFDLNYLIVRANTLKLKEFRQLSRLQSVSSNIRDTVLSSRGMGTHENKSISEQTLFSYRLCTNVEKYISITRSISDVEGRVQMDMLEIIRRDYKLKSYTLNAVSAHFLKEQKEDVHYSQLADLFKANADTRRRVAVYCLKDAILPIRLMEKLLVTVNYVEMSRVTGTPLSFLLTRGQQIKVTSQLLHKCKELDYLFPSVRTQGRATDDREVAYEGATVLEPIRGLYKEPIATLDFASLYPSIMMAHNLCYSTLCIHTIDRYGLAEQDVTRTPSGTTFVKATKRKGVLPLVVEELIAARKKARKEMEIESDPMRSMVLNGRQLALKLSANSVYGYTGAVFDVNQTGGQLPCLEVSTAITAYGRTMIDFTKESVEAHFTQANGYPLDAKVIYGDTDSVMVNFHVTDIAEAMRLGKEASELVTKRFVSPIKLEFEKVFCPFLLMSKKRYAGLLYTNAEKYSKIDCKGIETVRRDFCLLVQQLVDTVLKKLLIDQNEEDAKLYTKQIISDLLQNKIDLSLLVVSKSLGKEDYSSKLAHVELVKKLRARDPGTAPQIGDRVHFVIVPGVKGQPQYDRAEDPLYVLENNLSIDTQYYLDNIKNPIMRIFEGVMDNPESLFGGSHTQKKKVLTSSAGAMSKFVKASLRCLSCRAVIEDGALCKHCKESKEQEIVLTKMKDLKDKEIEFAELWTQCQRCQGSIEQCILCTSRDCPIFYRRMKIRKDIQEIQDQVERLTIDSLDW